MSSSPGEVLLIWLVTSKLFRFIISFTLRRRPYIGWKSYTKAGPDSVMVRASASEAGGAGSNLGRVIPKTLKMVPVATLLGAQHS